MENQSPECVKDSQYCFYSSSDEEYWGVSCYRRIFVLNHHQGIRLCAKEDETLSKVIFDTEKKKIEVVVMTPSIEGPRIVDVSDNISFFEDLRANIEDVLLTGGYSSVKPNEERTLFEVE